MTEEQIKQQIEHQFGYLKDAVVIKRARRLWLDVPMDKFEEVFVYLTEAMPLVRLLTITGMDEGTTFGIIYHLAAESGIILNLRIHIPRENPAIQSMTSKFSCADIYEREIKDLLGIQVLGLPEGRRYPLTDNWPDGEYPLRKDWKGLSTEKKGGTLNAQ
ncbi:MAG TPA: NADH-quinone oxidoreductase subunit C [Candidatus Omnitrophota bacterium]|nr:NADH-quinone oxidoreductase subunit C [Candidatus Omnitrophota bacterium]HPD84227.1 NADH-quinone oxidoreductase subunit C [Candidatus Omnitrophota bacterium]HRZ03083.1 NADH-quinone oxidoreductase subunit C [Candidatus Omnitrophota bacterium]